MKKLFLCLPIFLFLYGCVEKSIVDEIQLVESASFDYTGDNKIEGTASITVHRWNEQISSETISASAETTEDIRFLLDSKSANPIHTGKLNTILFSEKLISERPILPIIDTFTRDPSLGRKLYLAVTSGPAKDLYKTKRTLEKDISVDIQKMIKQNIERQNIPKSDLHTFLKQSYQVGQTPYMPYLRKSAGIVQVDGVALLKDDKFAHKINLEEAFLLKLLVEKFSNGVYQFSLDGGEHVFITNIKSRSRFKIEKQTNTPTISISIYLAGRINEYTGLKLTDKKIKEINDTLKKKLESDMNKLIRTLQEKDLDPVGFGSRVKSSNRDFNPREWEDYYRHATIDLDTNIELTGSGISK